MHLERTSGPLHFHTSRVDLQLARVDGELEISPNADLTADQIVGPVVLNTRNRNITLERVAGDLSITNRNGSVTVTAAPPLGNITIENRNSPVDLTLPTDAGFTVQAETSNADLDNDFGLSVSSEDSHPRINGTVGKGGPAIRISTTQADLSLHRGNIAPLTPPLPPAPPLTPHPLSGEESLRRESDRFARNAAERAMRQAADALRQANADSERNRKKPDGKADPSEK